MRVRNRSTAKEYSIADNTLAASVIKSLKTRQKETGTGTLARIMDLDTTIVLPECKKLRSSEILSGYLGHGGALYYHPKYGKLVHQTIERIIQELEKAGLSEEEIKTELQKIFKEAKFLGRPLEWKWRIRNEWEILAT